MKFDIDVPPAPAVSTLPHDQAHAPLKNPERLAWLVLWGAFTVCILLTITLPLGARHFLLYAEEARTSTLEAISLTPGKCGTVSFTPPNATQPSAVTCDNPTSFPEGSLITTDSVSRAFVTFYEGSTAQVKEGSRLTVEEMRQPRFKWSELPNTIQINQERGLVRYGVARAAAHSGNPDGRVMHLEVDTPDFDVALGEGSYSVEVTDSGSQVIVWEGLATIHAREGTREVTVSEGQRIQAAKGQPLPEPVPAAQNLVRDGNFSFGEDKSSWDLFTQAGSEGSSANGTITVTSIDERRALRILRADSGSKSADTGVIQQIDRDVSDFRSLNFFAFVRLHNQSLSGGGYLGTEYPLILYMKYRDINGNEHDYVHGFYYQNTEENSTKNGEPVPRDQWIPFETSNLLEMLKPQPFRILYIKIYASGWDYESYVSGVRLTVE